MTTVHALLLQFPASAESTAVELARDAERIMREFIFNIAIRRIAHPHSAEACYVYLELAEALHLTTSVVQSVEHALHERGRLQLAQARISRLQCVMRREGPSIAEPSPVHYVVETDPEAGWKDEMFRWYDEEHLPGLASVPGTVRAERYLNLDHGPLSLACYDLVQESVMGCPEWLAVRGTEWSSQVRPHFTNTKRTMFAKLL